VGAFDDDIKMLKSEVQNLRDAVTEHRVRLENGVHAFRDIKMAVEAIDRRTTPRSQPHTRTIAITLTVVLAGAASLWALSSILNEKTTEEQVEKVFRREASTYDVQHRTFELGIDELKRSDVEQKASIKSIQTKLDGAIQRLPPKKSPRRRRR
jgi:hypothetical protein